MAESREVLGKAGISSDKRGCLLATETQAPARAVLRDPGWLLGLGGRWCVVSSLPLQSFALASTLFSLVFFFFIPPDLAWYRVFFKSAYSQQMVLKVSPRL